MKCSMHIAIDARMYGTKQRGIGRYLIKLLEHLEIADTKNQYTIFLRRENWDEYRPKNANFKIGLWDAKWYGLQEQLTSRKLESAGADLYHFPHWNIPLFFNNSFIVTIHDLELFSSNRTRENSTRGRLIYWLKYIAFRIVFRHAVLASKAVIVPSNVVREQLLDLYPKARKKVHVIYEAPTLVNSSQSSVHSKITPAVNREPMTDDFVLYIGAAYPHKNLLLLLKAWPSVQKEFPDYKLVLVGRPDFFWDKLKQRIVDEQLALNDSVVWYGEASDSELAALYKNASLLVQPSLEEGFSLPPLEALSFGCPAAVSSIPVHHEVLKDAAFYFDPSNVQNIAFTLKHALGDLAERKVVLIHAQNVLQSYSWKNNAQATLEIYKAFFPH